MARLPTKEFLSLVPSRLAVMRIYFFSEGPKFEASTREDMLAAAWEPAFGPCKGDVRPVDPRPVRRETERLH